MCEGCQSLSRGVREMQVRCLEVKGVEALTQIVKQT